MGAVLISSRDNPRIKNVIKLLSSAKARRENRVFAAEGMRLCSDVLESNIAIRSLFYTPQAAERYGEQLLRLIKAAEECFEVSQSVFDRMGDTVSPQGVLAVCGIPDSVECCTVCPEGRYLAMERVGDPSNLGAAARTAEAFGLDGIILGGSGCDPFSPKALRASMGALVRLPVFVCHDFCGAINELRRKGSRVLAAVVRDGTALGDVCFKNGDIVLIGNEAEGLSPEAISCADESVTIPMSGRAESLNAATAAAIFIWEMTKGTANE